MRGRQAGEVSVGYTIDFYRVEALEPGKLFRLQAELKAPGAGWMEWRIKPQTGGTTALLQIAYFAPKGMAGFHLLVFPISCSSVGVYGSNKRDCPPGNRTSATQSSAERLRVSVKGVTK